MQIDIPKQAGVETHSVKLQFRWQDQGWGNRKGRLYIVQDDPNAPQNPNARFAGGKLICETEEDAPHEPGQGSLLWHPSEFPSHQYSLWYKVGSGGGHALRVTNFSLTKFIFDDANLTYSKTYRRLHDIGALRSTTEPPGPEEGIRRGNGFVFGPHPSTASFHPNPAFESRFFPQLLLGVCQHFLRTAQPTADPDLVATFKEFQLDTDEASVRAVQHIIQHELLLHDNYVAAEAAAPPPRPPPRNVREFMERQGGFARVRIAERGAQPPDPPPHNIHDLLEQAGFAGARVVQAGPFLIPDDEDHPHIPPPEADEIMREVLQHLPPDMDMPFGAIMGMGVNGHVVVGHMMEDRHNEDDEMDDEV
jgi:hypothetical protein